MDELAHTILVRLDVDDEYADIHPEITATDYLEGSKALGWEVITERVFTESEVRALMAELDIAKDDPGSLVVRRRGEPLSYWKAAAKKYVMAKHGLSDPA